jgi:hypothetical protein
MAESKEHQTQNGPETQSTSSVTLDLWSLWAAIGVIVSYLLYLWLTWRLDPTQMLQMGGPGQFATDLHKRLPVILGTLAVIALLTGFMSLLVYRRARAYAIIGILVALPAIGSLSMSISAGIKAARVTRVNLDARRLEMALRQYDGEYVTMYSPQILASTNNKQLVAILSGNPSAADASLNPKRISFLPGRSAALQDGQLMDPWGSPYRVILSTNDAQAFSFRTAKGEQVTHRNLIWSLGPNRRDEAAEGDDIVNILHW